MFTRSTLSDNDARSTSTTTQIHPEYSGSDWCSEMGRGAGTLPPSSMTVSSQSSIASRALSMASSSVSPPEKQPGRSGTTTPNACCSSPGSIAMVYLIAGYLSFQPCLLEQFAEQAPPEVLARVRHADVPPSLRVRVDVVRTLHRAQRPSCMLQLPNQFRAAHNVYRTHSPVGVKSR